MRICATFLLNSDKSGVLLSVGLWRSVVTGVMKRLETEPDELAIAAVYKMRQVGGRMARISVTVVSLVCLGMPTVSLAQDADQEQGKRLYESQCGSCHGPSGNGGKGANLAQPQLRRATDDQALFSIIRRGIPGTEMPGSPLTPGQVSSIAGYVKTLGRIETEDIPGDEGRGKRVYESLDCARCHTLNGRGGVVGPGLEDIGLRRSPAYLREALIEPETAVPDGFLLVEFVTRDGRSMAGVRVNEDAFSIQFRDLAGEFHSFWKDELDVITKQWQRSPMGSYGSMTAEQINDLVAFLASLKVLR